MVTRVIRNLYGYFKGRSIKKEFPPTNTFRFLVAKTEKEFDAVFSLRWQVYSEEGYIRPEDFPDKRFKDRYDEHSIFALVLEGHNPVGCVRLVLPSERGFPMFEYYNIEGSENLPRENAGEVSRFCVARDYRNVYERMVTLALLYILAHESAKRRVEHWYAFMPAALARSFEKFGMEFTELPQLPLEERHIQARAPLEGYFRRTRARPYLFSAKLVWELFHHYRVSFPVT